MPSRATVKYEQIADIIKRLCIEMLKINFIKQSTYHVTYNVSLVERLIRYAYAPSTYITFNFFNFADFEVEECLSCLVPLDFFKSTCPTNANLYHANIITTWFRIYLHRTNARANIYEQVARRNHRPWRECSLFSVMHFCQKLLTHFIIFNKKYSITLPVPF